MTCITIAGSHNASHNRLWRHYQDVTITSETRRRCVKIVCVILIYTHYAVLEIQWYIHCTDELGIHSLGCYLWCLLPSLPCNWRHKHQNNICMSAWTGFFFQFNHCFILFRSVEYVTFTVVRDEITGILSVIEQQQYIGNDNDVHNHLWTCENTWFKTWYVSYTSEFVVQTIDIDICGW